LFAIFLIFSLLAIENFCYLCECNGIKVLDMAQKSNEFATKIGLIAATVGSAIGLGNVWRFPAETQVNGGAAFLLLYIACVLILGIPVMLGEFALGRGGRGDAVGVYRRLAPGTKWWIVGAFAVLTPYLITIYYMVVAGCTLEYLVQSVTGTLYALPADAAQAVAAAGDGAAATRSHFSATMQTMLFGSWQPMAATAVVIALNIAILLRGVQKGIERLSNVLMPLLFLILIALCVVSLTLPGAGEGLKFFLSPDFSKIDASVVVNALGQAFFSLSLGMGILITYSSYYPLKTNLPKTSVTVALLSLLVAVLMGIIIFPAVKTFGLENDGLEGTTLIFITLPEVFAHLPLSQLWSTLFFTLLLVAAITSTVSLAEVAVAFLAERCKMKRSTAVLTALGPLFVLSSLCALSVGPLKGCTIFGMTFFDALDNFATNILLPLVSICTCLFVGWFGPRRLLHSQLTNRGTLHSPIVTCLVTFVLRYVAPVLIAAILVSRFV
jgi:NSS family neurotransmitter:Na+ symporter